MPKTILIEREPMPSSPFCVCAMRGMGGRIFFSYYAETAIVALTAAKKLSGAKLLYVVRVKPKRKI